MKILLVYPEMPSTFWTMDNLIEVMGKKATTPPLGLLTVAALLPKEWEKRLVDINTGDELDDEALEWADYVFIGAMNVQIRSVREVIARCRETGTKIVAGGPLFTHEHETFEGVDHFVLNEAEITLPLFLADLEAGNPKPIYTTPEFADVLETPIPLWEIADMNRYAYGLIQYSRGCPYMCDFCDVTALFGRKARVKTPEQMIAELDSLGDLNRFRMVFFADDNLIGNQRNLKKTLLPALIDWRARTNAPVGFTTQATINLADDAELMRLMLEAGFRHIFSGIETPEEGSLLASSKRQNTKRDLLENIRRLHEAGFILMAGFIVGFDTDTPESYQRQIDFIQESGIVMATINLLKAPPGTELYEKMRKAGRLIEPFDFDENESNIIPMIDPKQIYDGFEYVLRHAYSFEYVYERTKTFLKAYPGPKVKYPLSRKFSWQELGTFFRILYSVGMVGAGRRTFWKTVGWSLLHRPKMMAHAVLYATLALHYRAMYQRYDAVASTRKMEAAIVNMPAPAVAA